VSNRRSLNATENGVGGHVGLLGALAATCQPPVYSNHVDARGNWRCLQLNVAWQHPEEGHVGSSELGHKGPRRVRAELLLAPGKISALFNQLRPTFAGSTLGFGVSTLGPFWKQTT
jgi:hypothetical protein